MQAHLVGDVVEQYVMGALDADSVRWVESHVAQCEACARLLQQEAQLEVALFEVAQRGKIVSLRSTRRRMGALIASVVAIAAGVSLIFTLRTESAETARPAVRRCADPSCISKAQFDGVITLDDQGEPIIPLYDLPTGGTP